MSEDRLQLASLSVLGGPLHGRRYNPEEVVGEVLIGSDSSCHLVLDLPTISPIHAKVWTDLGDSKLLDTSAPRGVYLNNERVQGEARLDEGDVFWLGAPQEAGSVCIKCHFKPWVEVLPTAPVGGVEPAAAAEAPAVEEPALDAAAFEEADAEEPSPMLDVEAAGVAERLEPSPVQAAPEESVPEESGLGVFPAESHVAEEPTAEGPLAEEAAHEQEAAPAEATRSEPEAAESKPAAAAAAPDEDDPFFVGEAAATASAAAPAHVAEPASHEEPSQAVGEVDFGTASQEPPTEHVPVAMSDDWSISETPAEAEPAPAEPEPPAAPIADDFFVTDEPKPAELLEPTFIEPEPAAVPASEPVSAAPFLDLPPLEPPAAAPVAVPPPAPSPARRPAAAAAAPVKPAGTASPPASEAPAAVAAAPTPAAAAPAAQATAAPEAPAAGAPKPAVRARPQPGAARRPTAAAAPARRPGPARPAARGASGPPSWVRPAGLAGAGLLVVGALGFGAMKLFGGSVRLDSVEPKRVRVGQHATLSGAGFGTGSAAQAVLFGDREAKVLQASPSRLEVEVPETGGEGRVPVVVRANGRSSSAVEVDVFLGPRLHGISPGSAMPGEEVTLAGAGWAVGATVRFGSAAAQTLDVQPTQIRAIVPEIAGGPGTQADVVVTVAGVDSNPAPFVLGHLPAPSAPGPPSAAPGDGASAPATAAATPAPAPPAPAAAATPTPSPLQLEGGWTGSQVEQGQRQYLSVSFRGNGGTVAFEGGITFTVPMLSVDKPRRDQLHFSVQIRGGFRHYSGRWDGEAVKGNVSTDEAGKNVVATFELKKR